MLRPYMFGDASWGWCFVDRLVGLVWLVKSGAGAPQSKWVGVGQRSRL